MPKLLPLPLGRAVSVWPVPVTVACQLFCRVWLPLSRMVAVQGLVLRTVKFTLNRSLQDWPALTLTVQLPPPPPPPVEQVAVGRLLLPLRQTVMPKLLPLPFGVAVRVCPLPVTVACQLACSVWLP